ncbi:hypothetical protein PT974_00533 [Cladobotryum mycophilum]|uniref:Uncharacterized protein n=1 Tax=Cladobotryum mycophilum TaxID=491253 RepID=A0ABR0SLV8_9HYPO
MAPHTRSQRSADLSDPLQETSQTMHTERSSENELPRQRVAGHTRSTQRSLLSDSLQEPDIPERQLESDNIALRNEIAQLREYQKLSKAVGQLRKDLRKSLQRRGDHSDGSSSSSEKSSGIKIKNLTVLTMNASFQAREEWLRNLYRAFSGQKKKYRKGYLKVLFGVDYMDTKCQTQWELHLKHQESPEARQKLENDWEYFENWTMSLLKDADIREPRIMQAIEKAKQREHQSPRDFHVYLDSLESQFPMASESQRAYSFYAKLQENLQHQIVIGGSSFPKNREEMVALATRYWEILQPTKKHSGAEVDVISVTFAEKYKLTKSLAVIPPYLRDAEEKGMKTYGVWEVPLRLVDTRGTTKTFTRLCVGIDRDPREQGSPLVV